MLRHDRLYLEDIIESCDKVVVYRSRIDFDDFRRHDWEYDGIVRQLSIIGEAARSLTDETRDQLPGVDWARIGRFRNLVIHRYFNLDDDVLWDICNTDVSALLIQIRALLERPS